VGRVNADVSDRQGKNAGHGGQYREHPANSSGRR
jgi:hypothetical protein